MATVSLARFFVFFTVLVLTCMILIDAKNASVKKPLCKHKHFNQKLDHFSFAHNITFSQRYIVCQEYWKAGGPIFFYTGNEGDIMLFVNNTGFMFEIAPKFRAMVIFAEHRYYGKSIPFDGVLNATTLPWLTSTQALADYNDLILYLKTTVKGLTNSPVIAFGGSYGGMLSAWMRMKYPSTILGALASSAPILQFGNLVPCNTFARIATDDYKAVSENCMENIRRSWTIIAELWPDQKGRDVLQDTFHVCGPLDDQKIKLEDFRAWLFAGFTYMAMTDYPYPTNFLQPLPGWPVKAACQYLNDQSRFPSDHSLLHGIYQAVSVYYNFTGQVKKCFNVSESSTGPNLGDTQWDFQACTELVMPDCTNGQNDMFYPRPWNKTEYKINCRKNFGADPDWEMALREYGGKNLRGHSNIIFSNGKLDPWSGGGVLETDNPLLNVILIEDGAHHLDLRPSHPNDPASVISAREQEIQILKGWINQNKYGRLSQEHFYRQVVNHI